MIKRINQMPVKTWNWLKVNEVELNVSDTLDTSDKISIHADKNSDNVTHLPFDFKDGIQTEGKIEISVDSDINHTVVMDFKGEKSGFADITTDIKLDKNAVLTLVQVHRIGDEASIAGRIDASVGEKAEFRLLQIFIRGKEIYADVHADLSNRKSKLRIDTGYLTTSDHTLDINYESKHTGELSSSDISVSGALTDKAVKRFRGTIDFKHGAVGAVGNELENVLMLDDGVINQTVPIILCEEEDVEGNHGATIGKLDADTLYYMKSRGMDEESIREMMKRAYVDAVLRKIPDEAADIREKIRTEEGFSDDK